MFDRMRRPEPKAGLARQEARPSLPVRRPVAGIQAKAPGAVIQRAVSWVPGKPSATGNLAVDVMSGAELGSTQPTLNGTILGTAQAIAAPTLHFTPSPASGGGSADAGAPSGVDATIDSVPTNTGSFFQHVLAPGPWSMSTTRAAAGARIPSLTACKGADKTTFSARGRPSDAAVEASNVRHEAHHSADLQANFNATIGAWDAKVTAAKARGASYHGNTQQEAQHAFDVTVGGTPNQIESKYISAAEKAKVAFHGTREGGLAVVESATSSKDCSTSEVQVSNPG